MSRAWSGARESPQVERSRSLMVRYQHAWELVLKLWATPGWATGLWVGPDVFAVDTLQVPDDRRKSVSWMLMKG